MDTRSGRTPLLFETLRIEDGRLMHLSWHNGRMNRCRREIFGAKEELDISKYVGNIPDRGVYRCKVYYTLYIESVDISPYLHTPLRILGVVEADMDYGCKYADRSFFEKLRALSPDMDDVVIVRDGLLSDTTTANIALQIDDEWFTPAKPLLEGTTRKRLLEEGRLRERDLHIGDLYDCDSLAVMNALRGFEVVDGVKIVSQGYRKGDDERYIRG